MYLTNFKKKIVLAAALIGSVMSMSTPTYASQRDAVEEMSKDGITAFMHFNEIESLPIIIPWDDRIDNFPVEPMADMLEAGGVKLLIFTITHHDYNLPFPLPRNASANMKRLYAGRRESDRDLMNDFYEALNARGIKLGFYINPQPDTETDAFEEAIGYPDGDWVENLYQTVEMISDKYGDKIFGWWIDNLAKNRVSRQIDPAELAKHLRSGNPDALIAYNMRGQSQDRQIPFADDFTVSDVTNFTAGHLKNKDLNYLKPASKFDSNGLLNYRLEQMQRGWAVQEPGTEGGTWHNHRYPMPELLEYMYDLRSVGAVISWNVAPFLDGSIDERVVNQWVMIGQAMKHGKAYVPESDKLLKYSGFNTKVRDLGASDAYAAVSSQRGDTATITYNGSRIELWGKKQPSGGNCSISIDGSTVETISQNSRRDENQVKFFDSGPLQSGRHTLEFKNVDGGVCTLDHVFYTPELADRADGAEFDYGSGWGQRTRSASYGNTIHYTNRDRRSADFEFTGDRFQIFSQAGPDGGVFDVWINGEVVGTVDTYNPTVKHQALVYSSPILVPGFQDVRVRTKGASEANPASSNSWVHIDYIQYNETVPEGYSIASFHHDIDYDDDWRFEERDASHFNLVSFSNVANTRARYRFNGKGIKIFARTNTASGNCQIRIDGKLQRTVDLYSPRHRDQVEIFNKQTLSDGDHTLDFVVDGTKSSASSDFFCVLERFEVTP